MTKRIITKIGDIFCVEVDNDYKCYFQYVANDMTVLNSSVIRVFAKVFAGTDTGYDGCYTPGAVPTVSTSAWLSPSCASCTAQSRSSSFAIAAIRLFSASCAPSPPCGTG